MYICIFKYLFKIVKSTLQRNLELSFSYYDDDRVDTPAGRTVLLENATYVTYALVPHLFIPGLPNLTNGSIPTNNSRYKMSSPHPHLYIRGVAKNVRVRVEQFLFK